MNIGYVKFIPSRKLKSQKKKASLFLQTTLSATFYKFLLPTLKSAQAK